MRRKNFVITTALTLIFVLLLVLELFSKQIFVTDIARIYLYPILTRAIAGAACLIFLFRWRMSNILSFRTRLWHMAVFLPCMAIAVNNFPIIPFFKNEVYINATLPQFAIYALLCLCVGFFEEMAFRGCIFPAVLLKLRTKPAGVFWSIVVSSAIFGVIHLLNIINGASVGATILQVGYSFLIGGMCSVILVKTQNIWYCVILHAVYNFAGGVVPQLGGGDIWTLPEIILTVAVSVPVAIYVIYMLVHITEEDINKTLNLRGINADIH